jgi:hypothetical protein
MEKISGFFGRNPLEKKRRRNESGFHYRQPAAACGINGDDGISGKRQGKSREGLKPLKQSPFLDPEVNTVRALLHGIGLKLIPFSARLAAILEIELQGVNRADHAAGAIDIAIQHRRTGMRTMAGKTEELIVKVPQTDGLSFDLDLGDLAGCPADIGYLVCYLVPFVTLDKAH